MPNYCFFEGRVRSSKKESILKLKEWMQADYHYYQDENNEWHCECPAEHHFWRVFDFDYFDDFYFDGQYWSVAFSGNCAWSVYCCMFDGQWTYQSDAISDKGVANKGITLKEASKLLDLDVEIFSNETGMCFYEHFLVEKGTIVEEKSGDYSEVAIYEYDEYEEFMKYYHENGWDVPITEREFLQAKEYGNEWAVICDVDFDDLPYQI